MNIADYQWFLWGAWTTGESYGMRERFKRAIKPWKLRKRDKQPHWVPIPLEDYLEEDDDIRTLTIVKVALGKHHGAVLTDEGEMRTFHKYSPVTVPVTLPAPVKQIACNLGYNLALTEDGKVYQWLQKEEDGDKYFQNKEPTLVESLADKEVVEIQAKGLHFGAKTVNRNVYTWGLKQFGFGDRYDDEYGDHPISWKPFRAMRGVEEWSLGESHCVFTKEGAEIRIMGSNDCYQLGDENIAAGRFKPRGSMAKPHYGKPKAGHIVDQIPTKWMSVSAGFEHSLGVTYDGEVWRWGDGMWKNPLPYWGSTNDFKKHHIVKVFGGERCTILLDEWGRIFSMANTWGAPGLGRGIDTMWKTHQAKSVKPINRLGGLVTDVVVSGQKVAVCVRPPT